MFVRDAAGKVSGLTSIVGGGRRGGEMERSEVRFSEVGVRLNHFREYARREVMMPMRDGAKLHAIILRPVGSESSGEPLPFLMTRTPYGPMTTLRRE